MKNDVEVVAELIRNAPIGQYIGELGAKVLSERAAKMIDLADNEVLCEKGVANDFFYIVAKGRLAMVSESADRSNSAILHIYEKGDLIGELTFIDDLPHANTVRSLGNAYVVSFNKTDLAPLITEQPELMYNFMRAVIRRVHSTLTAINRHQSELLTYIQTGGRGRM